jgi:hypothetical protein
MKALILLAALAQAAFGQFALYRIDSEAEPAAGAVSDLGTGYPGEARTARFRLRNVSAEAAVAATLSVNGAGFELAGAPKLPVGLGPQEAFDFAVMFQASQPASYSAVLDAGGVSTILTAAVLPAITVSGGIAFGTVEAGALATRRVTLSNLTSWALPIPPLSVTGEAFAIASAPPGGMALQPGETAAVEIRFQPPGAGNWTGSLAVGERSYPLSGSVAAPGLPKPTISVELAEAASASTGMVAITFDAPAKAAGTGKLTISMAPPDPAVAMSLEFPFGVGDGGIPVVPFQTGTTAGTLAIAVEVGGVVERKSVVIPAAPVRLTEVSATRGAGTIEVRLAGFDNTKTCGPIAYTFYDAGGNALPAIAVDNAADFGRYFAGSDAGGWFVLRAVFPVSGDGSAIKEFAIEMRNAAGNTATGRLRF